MAELCAMVLFRELDLSRGGSYTRLKAAEAAESAQRLAGLAPILGHHLRHLTIQIPISRSHSNANLYDTACATILKHAPHLRFLKFFYAHGDISPHRILHDALAEIKELEAVEFWEGDDARRMTKIIVEVPTPRNDILRILLSYYSTSLRSLAIRGRIILTDELYCSLRDNACKLHTLEIRRAFPGDTFTKPVVWSCAPYLRHLQLYLCAPHAAHIVTTLMRGCLGLNLETVALWMTGAKTDRTDLRPPTNLGWAGAQLEKLDLDHYLPWEMECFQPIPTKILVATRMASAHFTTLLGGGAFPGLQTLVVSDRWQSSVQHELDYSNLTEACRTRGVDLRCTDLSNAHPDYSTMREPIERVCKCLFLKDLGPDYHPNGTGY